MKAFITGIEGFTGKHLVDLLKKEKVVVKGVDLKSKKYTQADLTDKEKLAKIVLQVKPDWVFHLASPILRTDQLIDETLEKNLAVDLFGTVNLLQAVAKLKKKPKVLLASTAAVYKKNLGQEYEETDKIWPRTAYGLSKWTEELISLKLAKSYQIPLVISRSILLIGTHQAEGFVVNDLIKQVAQIEAGAKKPVLWVGSLEIKRDFTDVRDGVLAYWTLMKKGKAGEIYNVCNGKGIKIGEIVKWLKKNSRVDFQVQEKKQWRRNDLKVLVGSNQKLKRLGWQPKYNLEESLQQVLSYWRRELKA